MMYKPNNNPMFFNFFHRFSGKSTSNDNGVFFVIPFLCKNCRVILCLSGPHIVQILMIFNFLAPRRRIWDWSSCFSKTNGGQYLISLILRGLVRFHGRNFLSSSIRRSSKIRFPWGKGKTWLIWRTSKWCGGLLVESIEVDMLISRFSGSTSAITFQQFVNVMSGKRTASFTCAVNWRDRGGRASLAGGAGGAGGASTCLLAPLNSMVSEEVLTDPRDRKLHTDLYRCWPPPWCLLSITILQLGLASYYSARPSWPERGDRGWADITLDSLLVFSPRRKRELWRFLSYCLIHTSWWHLAFNITVQLLLGVPLEMVHGSARVGIIYASGVLAGSLSTSVLDPQVGLVGASGGVYSLLAGHLANLVVNFNSEALGPVRLVATLAVASVEVEYFSNSNFTFEISIFVWKFCLIYSDSL